MTGRAAFIGVAVCVAGLLFAAAAHRAAAPPTGASPPAATVAGATAAQTRTVAARFVTAVSDRDWEHPSIDPATLAGCATPSLVAALLADPPSLTVAQLTAHTTQHLTVVAVDLRSAGAGAGAGVLALVTGRLTLTQHDLAPKVTGIGWSLQLTRTAAGWRVNAVNP